MSKVQDRVIEVLHRLADMANADEDDALCLAETLEGMLGELHSNDFFGTEGQNDPRGDFRNGNWHMGHVEGVDE